MRSSYSPFQAVGPRVLSYSGFSIKGPEDLQHRSVSGLEEVADHIRQRIISTCLKNGGHLGASLGTVELAVALHAVFDSPRDGLIWDVGHQAYAHQLICGRWERFDGLRQVDGVSGFLKRDESAHDVFGAGHSSTSLSAALAIAWAKGHSASTSWTVAIIGDGGLTAGLAFEALNNFHGTHTGPLLVVFNDNQMSISKNVGAMSGVFSGGKTKEYFELFGFEYLGPLDGHNLGSLIEHLGHIRQNPGSKPLLLHVCTQKGRGYLPAEELPSAYHGFGPIQVTTGASKSKPALKTYSQVFGEALCELAERDPKVVAISAAMPDGTGLSEFARRFPDRFFDVGIAEAHAVTFAAGLATQGIKPVVAIYSTFLQRAFDSIIHDVALQKLGVTFAIDRAGVVGHDGPTHHGIFDLAYLGMVPDITVTAPSCVQDFRELLTQAVNSGVPRGIRYPRASCPETLGAAEIDGQVKWYRRAKNPKALCIAVGAASARMIAAVRELEPTESVEDQKISLITTVQVKPIPNVILGLISANPHLRVITLEDGALHGGFGQSLAGELARASLWPRIETLGYGDHFIEHGTIAELEDSEGISKAGLVKRLKEVLAP